MRNSHKFAINDESLEEDTVNRGQTQYDRLREEITETLGESEVGDLEDSRKTNCFERFRINSWYGFSLGNTRTGLFPEGRYNLSYSTKLSKIIGLVGFLVFIGIALMKFYSSANRSNLITKRSNT